MNIQSVIASDVKSVVPGSVRGESVLTIARDHGVGTPTQL